MILVQGWVRLAPDAVGKFRASGAKMLAATRAEDGCILYAFSEAVDDPGLIYISERWRDQAAIDAHGKSAHMAEFLKEIGGLKPLGQEIILYSGEEIHRL